LLDQYTGLRAGVQGTLHVNKDTGRKLLIIETNGQS